MAPSGTSAAAAPYKFMFLIPETIYKKYFAIALSHEKEILLELNPEDGKQPSSAASSQAIARVKDKIDTNKLTNVVELAAPKVHHGSPTNSSSRTVSHNLVSEMRPQQVLAAAVHTKKSKTAKKSNAATPGAGAAARKSVKRLSPKILRSSKKKNINLKKNKVLLLTSPRLSSSSSSSPVKVTIGDEYADIITTIGSDRKRKRRRND